MKSKAEVQAELEAEVAAIEAEIKANYEYEEPITEFELNARIGKHEALVKLLKEKLEVLYKFFQSPEKSEEPEWVKEALY